MSGRIQDEAKPFFSVSIGEIVRHTLIFCVHDQNNKYSILQEQKINDCYLNGLCHQYSQIFTSIPTPLKIHFLVYRQKRTIRWSSMEQFLLSRLTLGHLCATSHG